MADSDQAKYWEHELAAFDRAFTRLLDKPEAVRPTAADAGGLLLERLFCHACNRETEFFISSNPRSVGERKCMQCKVSYRPAAVMAGDLPLPLQQVAVLKGSLRTWMQHFEEIQAVALKGGAQDQKSDIIAGCFEDIAQRIPGLIASLRATLESEPRPAAMGSVDLSEPERFKAWLAQLHSGVQVTPWDAWQASAAQRPTASGAGNLITDPKAKGYRPPGCDKGITGSSCCDYGCAADIELTEIERDKRSAKP
jgi:hypothetical protein